MKTHPSRTLKHHVWLLVSHELQILLLESIPWKTFALPQCFLQQKSSRRQKLAHRISPPRPGSAPASWAVRCPSHDNCRPRPRNAQTPHQPPSSSIYYFSPFRNSENNHCLFHLRLKRLPASSQLSCNSFENPTTLRSILFRAAACRERCLLVRPG